MLPATTHRIPYLATHAIFATWWLCLAGAATAQNEAPAPAVPAQPTRVLWKYAPAGIEFTDLTAANDVVFALDRTGIVHALDAASGNKLWVSERKDKATYGAGLAISAAADFDAMLVGCDTGFSAFDRKTGKQLWHTDIAAGVAGPACTANAVIAGSADGKVYACELRTGKLLWQQDYLEDRPEDPPGFAGEQARFAGKPARPCNAATDGKIVVLSIFDQCRSLAFDVESGKRLWDFRTQGWMFGRPAIGDQNVFVGSQDDHVYAVDKDLGKLCWQIETKGRNEAAALAMEHVVYFGSCDGDLYAADQVVGRVLWQFPTDKPEHQGAPIYSRPLVIGDTVYLAAMAGKVYALQRQTGKLLWQVRPSPKSELLSDLVSDGARLFVTTRKSGHGGEEAVIAIDAQ